MSKPMESKGFPSTSTAPTKDRSRSTTTTTSLYQVGSEDHLADPQDLSNAFEEVEPRPFSPTEATRLLKGEGSEETELRRKKGEESKKQLYHWLCRFGIISFILVAIITGIALLAVYLSNHRSNILDGCVKNYDPEVDYFPEKLVDLFFGLQITYYNHYKFVRIANGQRYVLSQCGTPVPTGYVSARYFVVPVHNISIEGQLTAPFLELLQERSAIRYTNTQSFVSPCMQKLLSEGAIQRFSEVPTEYDQQVNAMDVVFSTDSVFNEKFATLEAPSSGSPKERAAIWIQFAGIFFNLEKTANEAAIRISDDYDCHKGKVNALVQERPLAAWIDYTVTLEGEIKEETWRIWGTTELLTYISDAGATPLKVFPSTFSSIEAFHGAIANVSYAIDLSSHGKDWESCKEIYHLNETSSFPFVSNTQIWRVDKIQNSEGIWDWDERAVAQPNAVLEDLVSIFHPEYNPDYHRNWLRNIFDPEDLISIPQASDCSSANAPVDYLGTSCKPDS